MQGFLKMVIGVNIITEEVQLSGSRGAMRSTNGHTKKLHYLLGQDQSNCVLWVKKCFR